MNFIEEINQNLGIARKVCNVYFQDPADREDVMQEMMYQLWRSKDKFDGLSKFSTWMYRVCLNTALTYVRKRKAGSERLSTAHDQIAEQPSQNNEDAIAMLEKAISILSPVNKAIILLYLDDLSYDDIATIMGITKSNVSVRIVRIKKELESKLKDKIL
jgi:RNA polymerase sigma factor (sigma-70 family)